ncbi:hypothetical protein Tcan_00197 [Toxocara canis]|uniref:Uncharacterized protein n=1 Tax=Toxocara canis TaxID=6265 RepID=A0A0B2VXW6_TOXCA|nr:hypothetical protein Tcan_00197 [Toxocara canis]
MIFRHGDQEVPEWHLSSDCSSTRTKKFSIVRVKRCCEDLFLGKEVSNVMNHQRSKKRKEQQKNMIITKEPYAVQAVSPVSTVDSRHLYSSNRRSTAVTTSR